jgi:large subunit ribosomal protein L29
MASSVQAHELDEMNNTDLEARLREAKEELFNLRFQAATGQLESHGRLRTVKKDIARIYTVVRERELGIRSDPDASGNETGNETDNETDNEKPEKEGADA